jgi:RNA polymerase sigma-70 factor (ECF subfamily)
MEALEPPEPKSFEQLMLPHMDSAYNIARWLLKDPHQADDAVQEAFLRALKAFSRFRGNDGRAWLLTIVRNTCFSQMRANKKGSREEPFVDDLHGAPDGTAQENAVAWTEVRSETLNKALERLPAEFREVIVLHELEGMSYRQIAEITEIPLGTVMSRLARARSKLEAGVALVAKEDALP